MTTSDTRFGNRLRATRERFGWTQTQLAHRANVGVRTIRRIEQDTEEQFYPRFATACRIAEALQVRVEWLLWNDGPMLSLANMTAWEQHTSQSGPGTEGLPGYVILDPGGPWEQGADGDWRVRMPQDD